MKQELCRRERFSCCNGMSLERVTRNDGAQRTNGTKQVMNLEVNAGFRYVLIPYPVSHPHSDRPAAGRMRIFLARTSCSRCRTDGRHDGMSCVDNLSYQYKYQLCFMPGKLYRYKDQVWYCKLPVQYGTAHSKVRST
jgi:hypothetical protein